MSKETWVIAAGIWLLMVPYLGIPGSWRTTVIVITGALLIILGFFLRANVLRRTVRRSADHPFVENSVPHEAMHEVRHDRKERISSLN